MSDNPIDLRVRHVVRKMSADRCLNADSPDATLLEIGFSPLGVYEVIVALEDLYGIKISESDGPVEAWTAAGLARCVKRKLVQRSAASINWKDTFESLVFSGKAKSLRTPLSLHIDPTFRCNSRCIFCYDSSGGDQGLAELTLAEIAGILDECRDMDVVEVQIGGGEPFLRDDLLDIVRQAKKRDLRVFILSNGTLITEEKARRLAAITDRRYDNIQISLDGADPLIHDRQRGVPGNWQQALTGIRNLQKSGIQPVVNTVLTNINCDHIPAMIPFLIDQGVQVFRVLRLHPLGRCSDLNLYNRLQLSPEQSEATFEFLLRTREELVGQLNISSDFACIFPMSSRTRRSRVDPRPGVPPLSYACGAGTTKLTIAPDGSVFPCNYMYLFPELRVGSVRESTLRELWERDELWGPYRQPLTPTGKCAWCDFLYHCRTGCRILSYAVHGDMGAPDPGCHYLPEGRAEEATAAASRVRATP